MFDDMFDTAQEILTGVKQGAVLSSWQRLPKNCADLLPLPEKQRKKGFPIGLKNQGATCYLNSFLQILFHTPQLRKVILGLPLCKDNVQTKSDFVKQAQHNFLFGFQRLFSQMSLRDAIAVQTDYLNKAFGWEGKQHVQQQDMTEAMKIIFDTMERALFGTPFQLSMKNIFKGITCRYKSCQNCTIRQQRQEDFYDFVVQVNGINSLDQSLMASLTPESMDGDNKIFCESCQSKQDMWLGTRFKHFPNTLVFTLNRFAFDYQKFDRVKLNTFFQFDLEQKLTHLVDDGDDQEFQLYGVIVHRGSAHGGHYFCYIRDVLHQSNWQNSIAQAHEQKQKRQKQKPALTQLTEEQQKKRQQLQKQDKVHQLKQPQNKALLQNWYELNDSVITAIDAKKITSKYEGSQSAYILFYRRKNLGNQNIDIQVPEYFKAKIQEQNKKVREERQKYQFQKQHIVLKINGSDQKLSVKTQIRGLLNKYCPDECFALIMESTHNGLPYYPMQFNPLQREFGQEDTIEKHQIYHESFWKTYLITDEDYINIKHNIGKDKLPFEANILFETQKKKIVLYQDQTLFDFRKRIQTDFQIPYENQIVQLVTPYKEIFVTDDLKNDDVLLTKLGFIHESQVILKNLSPSSDDFELMKQQNLQKVDKDLLCFIIERDDQIGIKKFYFSKFQTLNNLLAYILKTEGIAENEKRRLRNLNGNRLYYIDHYSKQMFDLDFNEQMIKIRIQRGQIPIKGDICVKAKLQSKFQDVPQNTVIQKIFDPNTSISQLKSQICSEAKLNPEIHRIYLTDWMGEPVRSVTKENQSIFDASFSRQESICLRDTESPIGSQLLHFEIFVTQTGSSDNVSQDSFHSKTQIHKTVLQFKQKLLQQAFFKDKNIKPKQIRIRQLKRDYMFGTIWRSHDKLMKDIPCNTNKLVVQVLSEEQQLTQNQIVLILKKRNTQKKIYEQSVQLVFNAGKQPCVQDLSKAIKQRLQLSEDYPLMIIKYFNYNFQWLELSVQKLQKAGSQKKDTAKTKKQKGAKSKKQQKTEQTQNQQNKALQAKQNNKQVKPFQEKSSQQTHTQQSQVQKQNNAKVQGKQSKKKKKQKQNKPQVPIQKTEYLNIRKPPTLLKDGDWIGYANSQEIKRASDDLQTEEDLSLRFIKKNNKNMPVYKRNEAGGFKINVDF